MIQSFKYRNFLTFIAVKLISGNFNAVNEFIIIVMIGNNRIISDMTCFNTSLLAK